GGCRSDRARSLASVVGFELVDGGVTYPHVGGADALRDAACLRFGVVRTDQDDVQVALLADEDGVASGGERLCLALGVVTVRVGADRDTVRGVGGGGGGDDRVAPRLAGRRGADRAADARAARRRRSGGRGLRLPGR